MTSEEARKMAKLELKIRCLERRETFCPDCHDKVAGRGCWRCKAQSLEAQIEKLKAALSHAINCETCSTSVAFRFEECEAARRLVEATPD